MLGPLEGGHAPDGYRCPFCALAHGGPVHPAADVAPLPSDLVADSGRALAFVAPRWWPNNPGHVIVIPRAHVENLYTIDASDLDAVMHLVQRVAVAMRASYGCTGVSTRQHNEPDGGQDVWHLHVHVFPRYADDDLYRSHALPGFQPVEERADFARRLRDAIE